MEGNVITIESAASAWLAHLQTRRRKPIKPASAKTFRSYLDAHILPRLGQREVGSVRIAVLREFVAQLDAEGLSAKSQVEITACVKSIIASVCDAEGEPLYDVRRFNNEKIDLPIVNPADQHTPVITRDQIESALNCAEPYKCLYALAAGSGLRIGELLAVKLADEGTCSYFDAGNGRIHIQQSVWRGQLQAPKTSSAVRTVELPSDLGAMLASFANKRTGFLFGNGRPLSASTARENLAKQGIPGFHCFRRYRAKVLRAARTPDDLVKFWLGHSNHADITAHYAHGGITSDESLRREWCDRVGLGFKLP